MYAFEVLLQKNYVLNKIATTLQYILDTPHREVSLSVDDFARAKFVDSQSALNTDSQSAIDNSSNQPAMYRKDLFEGDIVRPTFAANELTINNSNSWVELGIILDPTKLLHRNAIRSRFSLWTGGIVPYVISSRYSSYR